MCTPTKKFHRLAAWDCVFWLPRGWHGGSGGIVDEDEAVRTQGGQPLLGQKVFRERCLASSGSQFGCHIANLTINVHNLEGYINNVQCLIFCHSFTSTAVSLVWKEWELYLNSRHGSKITGCAPDRSESGATETKTLLNWRPHWL